MASHWEMNDVDHRVAAEIQKRLPERLYDAHAHIYRHEDIPPVTDHLAFQGPAECSIDVCIEHVERQHGKGRNIGGLYFPYPAATCNIESADDYMMQQVAKHPLSRCNLLARPDGSEEHYDELLQRPGVAGLKVYHVYSAERPTWDASILSFLPEWMWRVADKHGSTITLHMVRAHALADPLNQEQIVTMCEKYPNVKLILAHAARGFNARDTVRGIDSIAHLDNIWFDTSGICETAAFCAIIDAFGPTRLLWGTDFPVSEIRGKCVTVSDAFSWINPPRIDVNEAAPTIDTMLVGLESTLAVLEAADQMHLNQRDIEGIFADNCMRMLGVEPAPAQTGQKLYQHAKTRIPGGTQLLSKRPEMFLPDHWPAYFSEARGCTVRDLDGNRYDDVSMHGIGSCLLGFRDPDVTRAVQRRVALGSMSTLNPPEEVELADRLCDLHPWAEQARFARSGGEIAAVAVRIARATTGRSKVAVCGYHGWADWYLAANLGEGDALTGHLLPGLEPAGVPRELSGTVLTFPYNDADALQRIIDEHGKDLAAIIMEPMRHHLPDDGFLPFVRQTATQSGAALIFDEITIGWRLNCGGAHLKLGVDPDMAIFAKALGNGHPIAAVIGTCDAMEGAHRSFISSTYWTESVGPAAALAVLEKFGRIDVPAHVAHAGRRVAASWRTHAAANNLPVEVEDICLPLTNFAFKHDKATELRTLYTQLMLERGFLASTALYATLAHTDPVMDRYDRAIAEVFPIIADAINKDNVEGSLKGGAAHTGFRRLVT